MHSTIVTSPDPYPRSHLQSIQKRGIIILYHTAIMQNCKIMNDEGKQENIYMPLHKSRANRISLSRIVTAGNSKKFVTTVKISEFLMRPALLYLRPWIKILFCFLAFPSYSNAFSFNIHKKAHRVVNTPPPLYDQKKNYVTIIWNRAC